jgi:glycyl-tRNA synthetase
VLKLPSVLAPTKAAILPLVKKDGLPEMHIKSLMICVGILMCLMMKRDVGRRYRTRPLEIHFITDHQTMKIKR